MSVFQDTFDPGLKLALSGRLAPFMAGEQVFPVQVEISPCQVCNAHCDWCFYAGTHLKMGPQSVMDADVVTELLVQCSHMGVKAVSWTGGGEPTLHPGFPGMVRHASALGLKQGLFTNALLSPKYDPSLFEWVRVSNTDKDWNAGAIKEIRRTAKKVGMALNYNGDDTRNGGDDAVRRALAVGRECGVDYVQVRQALNLRGHVTSRKPPEVTDPLLSVTDYKFEDSANPHGYTDCYGYHFVPFIWHDGDVDVCAYHRKRGSPYTLGNLHQSGFREIMAAAPRHVPVVQTCQVCCKNHECNKIVNKAIKVQDKDFL